MYFIYLRLVRFNCLVLNISVSFLCSWRNSSLSKLSFYVLLGVDRCLLFRIRPARTANNFHGELPLVPACTQSSSKIRQFKREQAPLSTSTTRTTAQSWLFLVSFPHVRPCSISSFLSAKFDFRSSHFAIFKCHLHQIRIGDRTFA
jgi:hypothetical protein